jgi:mannosyltransferase OCH1-like enzyme
MLIQSKSPSDISNIIIESDSIYSFECFAFYINENVFKIKVNVFDADCIEIRIKNKYGEEFITLKVTNGYEEEIQTPFLLVKETGSKIPKIIHQSYISNNVKKNMYNAINRWRLMNMNYEYKYWTDEECYEMVCSFGEDVAEAYNMLYMGAAKSILFRLCVLYKYGGVWIDVSTDCKNSIDKILSNHDFIMVADKDQNYGIYQKFICTEMNNPIIKHILHFTVNRVLNHEKFDRIHQIKANLPLNIAGSYIFELAMKDFFKVSTLNNLKLSKKYPNKSILYLHYCNGKIFHDNIEIFVEKYPNYEKDRTTRPCELYNNHIYKRKVKDTEEADICIYQIWIQGEYVSDNMYTAIQSVRQKVNYKILTNEKIIKMLKEDTEFPDILTAYNKVKPFAYKSDLVRYYVLYKKGGIYVDIDCVGVNPMIDLFDENDIVMAGNGDHLYNGFIMSKKGNILFKTAVETCIYNILNKIIDHPLSLTGSVMLERCMESVFNIEHYHGDYYKKNTKIKIISFSENLPLPKGTWIQSSKDYSVNGHTLSVFCENGAGGSAFNEISFLPKDILFNTFGRITGNSMYFIRYEPGAYMIYDDTTLYLASKYPNYDNERLLLEGNDFTQMCYNLFEK